MDKIVETNSFVYRSRKKAIQVW